MKSAMSLEEVDLENIEKAAKDRKFSHPADTLLLVYEVKRLREQVKDIRGKIAALKNDIDQIR